MPETKNAKAFRNALDVAHELATNGKKSRPRAILQARRSGGIEQ